MKHVGTIISKPLYKEVDLSEALKTVVQLKDKLTRQAIIHSSALLGGILLKAYMAISMVWLVIDRLGNRS